MTTTVDNFLRDFPRVQDAVFAGETVYIESERGVLRLDVEKPLKNPLFGCLKDTVILADLTLPTMSPEE